MYNNKDAFLTKEHQGVLTLMEMLNEASDNYCRNILMDHFIRASSKDKKA